MKRIVVIFLSLFLFTSVAFSQCYKPNTTFSSNELLGYHAVYNWGIIWIEAGYVEFKVQKTTYRSKPAYHFISKGISYKKYDWVYRVRDYFDSYASTTDLRPYQYTRNTQEDNYKVDNSLIFDYANKKIYSKTKNTFKAQKLDTLPLTHCTFDLLTAIYYARNLNFSTFKYNQKIPLRFVIDGELFTLTGRYLGEEDVELNDDRKFRCHKFRLTMVEGTIFKGGEVVTAWISADRNKIPIMVEAKILVGSVKVVLKDYKNLRYPLHSEIKKDN